MHTGNGLWSWVMAGIAIVLACAACGSSELPTAAATDVAVPLPISLTVSVLRAPAQPSIESLPKAHLWIRSDSDEPIAVTVTWRSEKGGPYRQTFVIPARGEREVWPDCFYWGRYVINADGWRQVLDYGAGVPFCYDPGPAKGGP